MTEIVRPEFVTDEHLEYLDDLRELRICSAQRPIYLQEDFGIDADAAWKILSYWMKTFRERHPES